jgi:hypothetical protein
VCLDICFFFIDFSELSNFNLGGITPTFGDLLDLKSLYVIDIYKICLLCINFCYFYYLFLFWSIIFSITFLNRKFVSRDLHSSSLSGEITNLGTLQRLEILYFFTFMPNLFSIPYSFDLPLNKIDI